MILVGYKKKNISKQQIIPYRHIIHSLMIYIQKSTTQKSNKSENI